ncbi:hypothetical protein CMQ_3683 [Grosmannia clavigera kw1407]|uniref:SWR1-complex protein 3 domain-containing protein n=1 Tax=Grosmannia clavigera (strain kw1407 / UAMH 11150) TaxID=655863 RepID=F0XAA6_GROCL|nr:uncharacterized protein CMQ_3683 [Grosmannia clavigera kw1407]EFX05614.1 hypothetical protein CMQ_3683 [Grosmannia clavigera kw1407]
MMERKRKLPARAAARVEQAAKRRTSTPPAEGSTTRSATPALSAAGGDDSSGENQAQQQSHSQLPKSIQTGKPLPTVEQAQPDNLLVTEYQSVNESGVLAESLSRSRQKWINEGIFEKYWAKPSKRRGVAVDDPKNPPKDSMVKLGQIVITVEPHVFEATMYGVKDPKPAASLPPNVRPIIMYGPSRGSMPPPSSAVSTPPPPTPKKQSQSPAQTPASMPATPSQKPAYPVSQPPRQEHPQAASTPAVPVPTAASTPASAVPLPPPPPPPAVAVLPQPMVSPRGMEGILSPSAPPAPIQPAAARPVVQPAVIGGPPAAPRPHAPSPILPVGTPKPAAAHPPGTDSIIVTLAERATEDPQLRDLMKRVANGNAPKDELDRFQAIIDQITIETKRNGAAQGPSADRLLVDGRTVRFFAEEVRIILDIVLRTNPKQTSVDLRPPAGSDPLVVLLVKTALDDGRVKEMVRRIGENRPQFSDATDLKAVLDKLKGQVAREKERERQRLQSAGQAVLAPAGTTSTASGTAASSAGTLALGGVAKANGATVAVSSSTGGILSATSSTLPSTAASSQHRGGSIPPAQQALRSKGPPPAAKLDVSAVVFEFAGGTGDRYLFPRFSIVEYVTSPQGQIEVVASFLIVRKGSRSEYYGDPDLDYYQPVTIRLQVATQSASSSSGQKLLDYLARVVAPADEVKRYMDNIMGSMTRAEYVLLAMRLPRKELADKVNGDGGNDADKMDLDSKHDKKHASNGYVVGLPQPMQGVLWTATATPAVTPTPQQKSVRRIVDEDQQYQNLIASVTPREASEA